MIFNLSINLPTNYKQHYKKGGDKMYNLTSEEKETIIRFDDSSNIATVYTCNKSLMIKLQKFCDNNPDTYKLIESKSDNYSKTFEMSKKLVSFRSKKVTKVMSDEQRQKLSENMKKMKQSQINSTL
jgi:hypothetical protein